MDGGFAAALVGVILYIVMDEAGRMGKLDNRGEAVRAVSAPRQFAGKHHQKGSPAFSASQEEIAAGFHERRKVNGPYRVGNGRKSERNPVCIDGRRQFGG